VGKDKAYRQAIFTSNNYLSPKKWYSVVVTKGVKDWAGKTLEKEFASSFQTGIGENLVVTQENSPYQIDHNQTYQSLEIEQGAELSTVGAPVIIADTITLDGKISGGNITLKANSSFTIGTTGIIDGKGKGGAARSYERGHGICGGPGGSFWGIGGLGALALGPITSPYAIIKYCFYQIAEGGRDGTTCGDPGGPGGGASVNIQVGGTITHNGLIDVSGADGAPDSNGLTAGGGGAGGSVFIKCDTFAGSGTIKANGGKGGDATYPGGGAGCGCISIHHEDYLFTGILQTLIGLQGIGTYIAYPGQYVYATGVYENECQSPKVLGVTLTDSFSSGSSSNNLSGTTAYAQDSKQPKPAVALNGGGDPIELSRGEFRQNVVDLAIPGRGLPFRFHRAYGSKFAYDGPLGYGWDFSYNARIVASTNYVDYYNGLAAKERYIKILAGGFFAPPGCYNTMEYNSGTDIYTVTERDATKYKFEHKGSEYKLTEIRDRNNNAITLSYNGSNQLVTITDTLNRNITVAYTGARIDYIEDFTGRKVDFTYDGNGDLWKVTSPTTTEYPDGKTTVYTYSTGFPETRRNHNILTITDPKLQNYITNYYDSVDRCWKQDYGTGTYEVTYTAIGKVTVKDRNNNITEYDLDPMGSIITETVYTRGIRPTDPLSFVTVYSHTRQTECVKTIFPKGNSVEHTVDVNNTNRLAQGNLLQTKRKSGANELVNSFTYEQLFNQVKTATDANGKVTTFFFDYEEVTMGDLNGDGLYGVSAQTHGNVVKIVYPTVTLGLAAGGGNQTSDAKFWYNDYGQLIRSIDPLGNVDTYEYYTSGAMNGYLYRISRDINGKNITNTFEYDNVGNITGIYDGKNKKTEFTVNNLNQVTMVTSRPPNDLQLGYQVTFDYDANDNLYQLKIENRDKDGNTGSPAWLTSTFGYDILDNMTSKTEQVSTTEDIVTGITYDNNENPELITLPETNKVKNSYDERDFIYQVKRGYGSTDEATTTFNYDINGNRTEVKNGRGKTTTFTFDGFDRCIQITDALGNYVVIAYDANSNITQITRRNSGGVILSETKYLYDEMNRNYEVQQWLDTTSSWVSTKKEFDKNSRVVTVRDANNHDTKAYYDGLGRVWKTEDHIGNHVDYILDANSNVITRTEYEKTVTGTFVTFVTYNEYDNLDRLIQTISPIGVIRGCFYDSRSNPTYTVDGEGNTVTNLYDGINRMLQVTKDMRQGGKGSGSIIDTIVTQYQWDKNSRLKKLIDDNTNETNYTFDELNRRKRETLADSTFKEFTYDLTDNPWFIKDNNGTEITQTFDDINRLTARSINPATGVIGVTSESFGYDGLSRMTSVYLRHTSE
jgi:YD repeat-containing protein